MGWAGTLLFNTKTAKTYLGRAQVGTDLNGFNCVRPWRIKTPFHNCLVGNLSKTYFVWSHLQSRLTMNESDLCAFAFFHCM